MLSQFRLKELLHYDADSGDFTWRLSSRNTLPGMEAGTVRKDGYVIIGVLGRRYLAHRLAWLYVYGVWPDFVVDHINGVPGDNRICNLRDVSRKVNQQNIRVPHKDGSSGYLGVSRSLGKWRANIWIDGRYVYIGTFDSAESAHHAYLSAKRKHHHGCTL